MKKNIYYFNSLLRIYNKCRRKLENLRKANRNERRQGILEKNIDRLFEKLNLLNASIKQKTVLASIAMATLAFAPQKAEAQNFGAIQVNPFSLSNSYYRSAPTFADIDGDGDLDMLSGSDAYNYTYNPYTYSGTYEYYFKYYQNTGTATSPVYATPVVNPFGIIAPDQDRMTPSFVDIDNDGDMDLFYGDSNGNFYYQQNIGTASAPSFAARQLNPFGLTYLGYYNGRSVPSFADIDNDGDKDMISGSSNGDFYYYQNTGTTTSPNFAAPQTNSFALMSTYGESAPALTDIDGDGDLDLMSGDGSGDFYYYQNTGTASAPAFASSQVNPFGLSMAGLPASSYSRSKPTFADIDNDGDMDLIAGDRDGNFSVYKRCINTTATISPISTCNYVSPSGLIKTTGGTFTDIIPNVAGCDSIITINLTINPVLNQTLTATNSTICVSGSTTINLSSSQNDVNYYLRDNSSNAVITGPLLGTGSALPLSTGTISNTTTYNVYAEKITSSTGLMFDGNDDYVDAGTGVNLSNSSFSIEFWAKKNDLSSPDNHVIGISDNTSTNNALHIGFRGNNDFTFAFFGNDLDVNSSYTDVNWHHWAVTFDATTKARFVYRDGIQVANDISSSNFLGTGTLRIGRAYLANNNNFKGNLDEVRIWNSVRSVSDINSNLNTCLSGTETNLLAYYKFENGAGSSTLTDATTNGNNGTLQNMNINTDWGLGASVCSSCNLQMTQTVTITVNPYVSPTITVNSGAICSGQSFTITPSGTAVTYTISGGNSVVSPTVDATYSVTGTGADGCVSASPAIASVTVNALPNVAAVSNNTLLCVGETATLTVSGANTYTWSTSENTSSIAVSPTVTTSYTVSGTSANGCVNSNIITQDVSLCSGINSIIEDQASSIELYPNPTNGTFYIVLPESLMGQKLILTNTIGQVLGTKIISNTLVDYNLENLSNGIYFIQVQTQNGIISKKIIKN